MNRDQMLDALRAQDEPWDLIVVGGGATGLGCAIDGAARGYRVLLLERDDFAKGTSSRSTKLVHGGVRYLRQGDVSLVLEALRERGRLLKNAPHIVGSLPFVVPNYDWWEGPFYGIGLKLYDLLAGRQGIGRSKHLSAQKTRAHLPTIEPEGLLGGVIYYDGQFDDARLAINMAQTAAEQGGVLLNYAEVTGLTKEDGQVRGVVMHDRESGQAHEIAAKAVINATGVFTDGLRRMDRGEDTGDIIRPSQGVHIVLDESFLPGGTAIMVPKTDDGRVLFAIPWLGRLIVGTTDTPVETAEAEPRAMEDELDFLLTHAGRYLTKDPTREDVLSTFAGLRPLVDTSNDGDTADISRDHTLQISNSGLVTIAGGKWTTYRKMAEDTIDQAATLAGLEERPSPTASLPIHGHHQHAEEFGALASYGSDAPALEALVRDDETLAEPIHPDTDITAAQVVWAAREEMARTVEDVLSRRTRLLLLDARASMAAAPRVAELLAGELGRDEAWQQAQVDEYRSLAARYLIGQKQAPAEDGGAR